MDQSKIFHVINNGDPNELTAIPGIGKALAKRLLSARPFNTMEELRSVKGINDDLLEKLSAYTDSIIVEETPFIASEEIGTAGEERKLSIPPGTEQMPAESELEKIPTELAEKGQIIPPGLPEEAVNLSEGARSLELAPNDRSGALPVETMQPDRSGAAIKGKSLRTKPSFLRRLGCAFIKLLIFLVIVAGILAAVYFGVPYLYEKFILPVEVNTARLNQIESTQSALAARLEEQIEDLKSSLKELEARQAQNVQVIEEMQGQVTALDGILEAHTETLRQLETLQSSLDALSETSARHESMLVGESSPLAQLQREISIIRAIELLSRSRLYLSQSNFGLARQDVQEARDLMAEMQPTILPDKANTLEEVLARLDKALENLPEFPVIAVYDVDIAWHLLVRGLPELPLATPTPMPVEATAAPTAILSPAILSPTATP